MIPDGTEQDRRLRSDVRDALADLYSGAEQQEADALLDKLKDHGLRVGPARETGVGWGKRLRSRSVSRIPATPRSWDLLYERRALPMNAYRRLHFTARAAYDREWRQTFAWLATAARIPKGLDAVTVTVAQTCRRPPLPDVAASYPTAKAAIDGLVDAGVIADDDPAHVRAITFVAPVRGDLDRFVLIVEEHTEGRTS